MWLGIRLEGWLTIAAIILGPLLAFFVQHERDKRREHRNRKLEIFRKLMMTLKAPLNPNHVDAINSIQVEFCDEKRVLEAWRLYTSHLNRTQDQDPNRWLEKKFDLLVELVYLMGQNLGYEDIDRTAIKDNTYLPKGYSDVEGEWHQIRKAWLEVLNGQRPLAMTMVGPVQVERPLPPVHEIAFPETVLHALPATGSEPKSKAVESES